MRVRVRVRARVRVRVRVRARARYLWMVQRSEMGGFGGGWLEHPRQWLGSERQALILGAPSCPEPLGVP